MSISFINGSPALMVTKERYMAVGDLHIGISERFSGSGIAFPNAAKRMAEEIRHLCSQNNAKGVVMLGDVKDGIGNPSREEMADIRQFFHELSGIKIMIAKGNHDAYLTEILSEMKVEAVVEKEILLSEVALMHGNAMPSDDAVLKKYIVCGHGHIAAQINGIDRKAWLVAPAGTGMKGQYAKFYRGIKLIAAPAFNRLIIGSRIGSESEEHLPLLGNRLFDFSLSEVYDLYGNRLK